MSYVRQEPRNFTENGIFNFQIEKYLGDTGSDALAILNKKKLKAAVNESSYEIFLKYDPVSKSKFCDFTSPSIIARKNTLFWPEGLSKASSKVNKNINPLAELVSCVAGYVLFATSYTILKTVYTFKIASELIKAAQNIKSLTLSVTQIDTYNKNINTHILKICDYKEFIYKQEKVSNLIGLILKIAIVASTAILIVGASVACYPLLIASAIFTVTTITAHVIKSVAIKRQLEKAADQILRSTEILRVVPQKIEYDASESTSELDEKKDGHQSSSQDQSLSCEKMRSPLLFTAELETPRD